MQTPKRQVEMPIAHVLLTCENSTEDNLYHEIKKIGQVKNIEKTFGAYNMIVKLESESDKKLKEVIFDKIKKMQDIIHTMTLTTNTSY